jgi:hypothetical protein
MTTLIETIFESEDFQNYMTENNEIMVEVENNINDFSKILKSFVFANPNQFIAENIDQTVKNIKTFAEVATCQYIQEISSVVAESMNSGNYVSDTSLSENEAIRSYL